MQESHIHSVVNVLRYCFLDEKKPGGVSLVSEHALHRLFECKELDYLTHVVIRMYENMEVSNRESISIPVFNLRGGYPNIDKPFSCESG